MGESATGEETPLPDREIVSILLHELRPFVLSNEPASYERVSGLISRAADADVIRVFLKQNRKLFDGRATHSLFTIEFDGTIVNSEAALQLWLNGLEYHRDLGKASEVENVFSGLGEGPTLGIFLSLLHDKVTAIRNLARLVEVLSGESTSAFVRLNDLK